MKKQAQVVLMMLMAAGFIISGCGKKEGKKEEPLSPRPAGPAAAVAPDAVVARVEGTVITGQMFNQQLNAMIQQYSAQVPPEQLIQLQPMLRQQAVESLINQNLLLKEALRQEIAPSEEDVDSQVEEISAQFPSPADFEAQLGMSGMTMDVLRDNIRQQLKIQKLVEAQMPEDLEATDEEIEAFYSENTAQFEQPEQVEASHILIQVSPAASEEDKAAKLQEIEDLRDRIEKGADFAETARESSQDHETKERGGSLGYLGRGQKIPAFEEFEEVAFALESGDLSEVVETQFGYHLIKVTGKRAAGTVPLEEVSEQIGMFLNSQKQGEVIGAYLRKIRQGADIQYGPGFQPPPPSGPAQFPPARLPE